ncbi:DUF262 domain-containing protein, partial [Neobacillus drentensis]|uniref:DUF262 domain-containing protein n=1 Tax=Neobacillus drentensis TaxID=220684 RepID=UPI002FFDBB14
EEYDDDIYNINSWGADLSFRELISLFKDEELIKPEIQRNYVWDKITASRFIESILLGLPIPSIFLAKMPDNRMLIVDGFQRVMSVYDFHSGIFKDGKTFKLSNSKKINPRWRGKSYIELEPSDQRKIRTTTIHAIIFDQRQPAENDTSLYQIFERINTGGRSLSPQEIRNCVYHNQFNKTLIKLNKNNDWRKLFGTSQSDDRMKDIEFILRFFALQSPEIKERPTGQISLKKFLNTFMGDKKNNKETTLKEFEKDFINVMEFLNQRIGNVAFTTLNSTKKGVSRFNGTVFDAIAIATNHVLKNPQLNPNFDDLKVKRKQLLSSTAFQDLLRNRTTNVDRINDRIDFASKVLYGVRYK